MHRFDRRTLITVAAGSVAIAASGALAQEGHHHGAATPGASPEAEIGTGTGVVYMTIANHGDEADTLLSARTDISRLVEVHTSTSDGSTATMQHLEGGLDIPAGESVSLEPAGNHLMLIDLNEDLLPESTFVITLEFVSAGSVDLTVPIVLERLDDVPPVEAGNLEITGYWSRPAPRLTPPSDATPGATPKG
jgi:copper(I)-binding protein